METIEFLRHGLRLESESLPALYARADEAFREFGYGHLMYGGMAQSGLPFFDTRHQSMPASWREHYEGHGYYVDDPVIRHVLTATQPFLWDSLSTKGLPRRIMKEAAAAGLTNGLTIPIRGDVDGLAALSLCGRPSAPSAEEIHDLEVLCLSLNALFHRITGMVKKPTVEISKREGEVLQWVQQGKTNAEIGGILGIAKQTVDGHVAAILRKYGTNNRTGAVVLGLLGGVIVRNPTKNPYL